MLGRLSTRSLLTCGALGPIAFVAVFLVEGATRPGYDASRQYVSLLSLGDRGWVQVVNFIVLGLLLAAFGLGLRRAWVEGPASRWAPRLFVIVGLGLAICGIFVADPAQGYPAGAPEGLPTNASWHAGLHYLGAVVVFLGLPAAILIAARRAPSPSSRTWAFYSFASALLMVGGWLATFTLASPDAPHIAGLLQRVAVVGGFQWVVATAAIELRRAAGVGTYAFAGAHG